MLLGRAVLDVRVCASPGRDMGVDERRGRENGSGEKNDGQKTKKGRKRGEHMFLLQMTAPWQHAIEISA